LEQQAQAAQDPIYPNLKSKDGGVTTEGVTTEGVTTKTDTDRLIDALKAVVNLEEFSQVVGGRQISMVENAIAGSGPDQPRRQQLSAWLAALQEPAAGESRTADPQEERRQLGLAKLLAEALEHGCDTVKAFLSRLDSTDRWVAAIKFEEIDEARSQQLLELHPDFYNWLSSGCIN
jgi:hypothetical protein